MRITLAQAPPPATLSVTAPDDAVSSGGTETTSAPKTLGITVMSFSEDSLNAPQAPVVVQDEDGIEIIPVEESDGTKWGRVRAAVSESYAMEFGRSINRHMSRKAGFASDRNFNSSRDSEAIEWAKKMDAKKHNGKCFIHPHSRKKVTWDIFAMVFLIYNIITVPYNFAFDVYFDLDVQGDVMLFILESIIGECTSLLQCLVMGLACAFVLATWPS